ncbi:uncharacterized protein VTP21DRAFT_1354 [Calcarisporiella thermophila]|uniref:uncharacterized protein n=1 Tax=Calcarisporiella thermophila TaxID=911321 RepID=UPI003743DECD
MGERDPLVFSSLFPKAADAAGSPPRTHTWKSLSKNRQLAVALEKARQAVMLDNEHNVTAAIDSYQEAIQLLARIFESSSVSDVKRLQQIQESYKQRLLYLSRLYIDPGSQKAISVPPGEPAIDDAALGTALCNISSVNTRSSTLDRDAEERPILTEKGNPPSPDKTLSSAATKFDCKPSPLNCKLTPTSPSASNLMVSAAREKARQAVAFDAENNYDAALCAYQDAVDLLDQALAGPCPASDKPKLMHIHELYTQRVRYLSERKQKHSTLIQPCAVNEAANDLTTSTTSNARSSNMLPENTMGKTPQNKSSFPSLGRRNSGTRDRRLSLKGFTSLLSSKGPMQAASLLHHEASPRGPSKRNSEPRRALSFGLKKKHDIAAESVVVGNEALVLASRTESAHSEDCLDNTQQVPLGSLKTVLMRDRLFRDPLCTSSDTEQEKQIQNRTKLKTLWRSSSSTSVRSIQEQRPIKEERLRNPSFSIKTPFFKRNNGSTESLPEGILASQIPSRDFAHENTLAGSDMIKSLLRSPPLHSVRSLRTNPHHSIESLPYVDKDGHTDANSYSAASPPSPDGKSLSGNVPSRTGTLLANADGYATQASLGIHLIENDVR